MPKRFRGLKAGLRYLNPPNWDGDPSTAKTPPVGSVLEKFEKAINGGVKYGARPDGSKPGAGLEVSILPLEFGAGTDSTPVLIKMSTRVSTSCPNFASYKTACGLSIPPAAEAIENRLFTPAIATVFVRGTGTLETKTSKFTGVNYKRVKGDSFSIPFGAKTGKTIREVKADILAVSTAHVISFKPERWSGS